MMEDPIVEEVRKAGREYFARFNADLDAIVEDLRKRSEAAGRKTVSRPPRRPKQQATVKKVG